MSCELNKAQEDGGVGLKFCGHKYRVGKGICRREWCFINKDGERRCVVCLIRITGL